MKVFGPALSRVDRSSDLYRKLETVHYRIAEKDPNVWGAEAATEAAVRLNWVDLPESSRALLPEIDALIARFSHIERFVLAGMGGSSLAPEVIVQSAGKDLFILDSTDPHYLAHALNGDLATTLLIVSSKSGSTIETSSARALFSQAFHNAGLAPSSHILVITDPGSPLHQEARADGLTVVTADPNVGGRFSALTAFGLVPSALAGVDVSLHLDEASATKSDFLMDPHAVIDVAVALLTQTEQYVSFIDQNSGLIGLSDWIEQLIAESTGKSGVGRLPIAVEDLSSAGNGGALTVSFSQSEADLVILGDLGEHFIFWEWVTALVGAGLEIDPFNQPNVTEAKRATSELLQQWQGVLPEITSPSSEGNVSIFTAEATLLESLRGFIEKVPVGGYIAIQAYLDRRDDQAIAHLRKILTEKTGFPVTFGWGPRFLHSTGQFHKGGQQNGAFLQITGECVKDFEIPEAGFTFQTLLMAQALGDFQALEKRKFPLLRLHLEDRSAGISQLLHAAHLL